MLLRSLTSSRLCGPRKSGLLPASTPHLPRRRYCTGVYTTDAPGLTGERTTTSADAASADAHASIRTTQQAVEFRWPWKWRSHIRYFKAGSPDSPALVLVHGFGVGAWHYERNIEQLAEDYHVFAVDLLGQGSSWPGLSWDEAAKLATGGAATDESHPPLYFSIDTWTQQLHDFVTEVVGSPAFVAGNSLGGYVAVSLASSHAHLVRGLLLLNCTPFWSFRPPVGGPQGLWGLVPLDGAVPVPKALKRVIKVAWWDRLRRRDTITSMLSLVYAHKPSVSSDEALVQRIMEATEHPSALDAFASILLSPKTRLDFDSMLQGLGCPVCLVYGRQDPWVVPLWGQRLAHVVSRAGKPVLMYLELDGAGHCPHHEAPLATNKAMKACLGYMLQKELRQQPREEQEQQEPIKLPLAVGESWEVAEQPCGRIVTITHVDGRPRIPPEFVAHASWQLMDCQQDAWAQLVEKPRAAGESGG